jgi:putative membrane protein
MTVQFKHLAFAMSLAFAWAGIAAFAAGSTPASESAKSTTKTMSSTKMMSDSDFAKAAAEGGMAEVKFGQLAEDKANNKDVKDLGQRMVTDHTQADDDLKAAVAKENISVPTEMDSKDQATYSRLSQLSGAAFDRAYARDMVRDHKTDIAMFRREANEGKDPAIKSFAAKTLPTLESHLKEAEHTMDAVSPKISAKTAKKSS